MKDMGGFMKSFAGNLGRQMGGGIGPAGGLLGSQLSPFGLLGNLIGGDDDPMSEDNPGMQMFKGKQGPGSDDGMVRDSSKNKSFLNQFGTNLSDQLFQRAMMGFMGR